MFGKRTLGMTGVADEYIECSACKSYSAPEYRKQTINCMYMRWGPLAVTICTVGHCRVGLVLECTDWKADRVITSFCGVQSQTRACTSPKQCNKALQQPLPICEKVRYLPQALGH